MSEFKLNEDGTIQRLPKTKVMLVSYSSGIPTFCPKCNSENILIFFGHDFPPNLIENWCEKGAALVKLGKYDEARRCFDISQKK